MHLPVSAVSGICFLSSFLRRYNTVILQRGTARRGVKNQ
jgi:hypothetical protein